MTHPHMTKLCKAEILQELEDFENSIDDKFRDGKMNEDARENMITVTVILSHEIERIVVEER